MKAAVARAAAGKRVTLPMRLAYHVVAARYGTTPAAVRDTWPADDVLDALQVLPLTASGPASRE